MFKCTFFPSGLSVPPALAVLSRFFSFWLVSPLRADRSVKFIGVHPGSACLTPRSPRGLSLPPCFYAFLLFCEFFIRKVFLTPFFFSKNHAATS